MLPRVSYCIDYITVSNFSMSPPCTLQAERNRALSLIDRPRRLGYAVPAAAVLAWV